MSPFFHDSISLEITAASIRRVSQGRAPAAAASEAAVATPAVDAGVMMPTSDAAVATPAADGETSQAAGIYLLLPLLRALPDNRPTDSSSPTTTITDPRQSDDVTKRKRKPKRKRACIYTFLPLPLYRALPDNRPMGPSPPTIPASGVKKGNGKAKPKRKPKKAIHQEKKPENSQPCDILKVTGEAAVTPGPASASVLAVQQKTVSIYVDVSNYTGMEIAWEPNDTGSGITCTFRGSI
ncbi:hypothetical protein FN846DRAFT_894940 [Sphaerosporella brunnea]|uniref:Uncharacterized protein n=1 Tax=Sphaerosporella brunnea TaxID=1250544 RepID=A0A5J5EHY6_9PEZI|nr:hypothetical protein FN846DRAFT_894940 [Sphaerosporella brunnea]